MRNFIDFGVGALTISLSKRLSLLPIMRAKFVSKCQEHNCGVQPTISLLTLQLLETPTVGISPQSHASVLQDGEVLGEQEEAALWKHVTTGECSNAVCSKWSNTAHFKSRGSHWHRRVTIGEQWSEGLDWQTTPESKFECCSTTRRCICNNECIKR